MIILSERSMWLLMERKEAVRKGVLVARKGVVKYKVYGSLQGGKNEKLRNSYVGVKWKQ